MPDRSPSLGNSIMQMAMQNRQMNLQANQSFQQAAQQDAQLRTSLLGMLMGDDLARDQMSQNASQFSRELKYRRDVHGDNNELANRTLDTNIDQFNQSLDHQEDLFTEAKRARGVDETFRQSVTDRANNVNSMEWTLGFREKFQELKKLEDQTNAQRRQRSQDYGVPYNPVDYTSDMQNLFDVAEGSGLGLNTGVLDDYIQSITSTGQRGGSPSAGAGVQGAQGVRVGGGAVGQGGRVPAGTRAPVGNSMGERQSLLELSQDPQMAQGQLSQFALPTPGETVGMPEHTSLGMFLGDIKRLFPFTEDTEEYIDRIGNMVENTEDIFSNPELMKDIRNTQRLITEFPDNQNWWRSEAEREFYREEGYEKAFEFNSQMFGKVIEQLTDDGEKPLTPEIENKAMQVIPREERRLFRARNMIHRMIIATNNQQQRGIDIETSLGMSRRAMAVKLDQMNRDFKEGKYQFPNEATREAFVNELETGYAILGQLTNSPVNLLQQPQVTQEEQWQP